MAIALALAATIPAPTIPVVLAASDEAGGDRKALDRLLDDAMRMAPSRPRPDGQPSGPSARPPTPAVRWTRACDVAGYDGVITGGDIVVYFLGAADKPDAISVDRGRTRGVVHGTYGTRVQVDRLPAHEWWPYTGGLTYELEVGKVVKEMLSGKVIRYGEVNNDRRWSFTKEQSLAGFSEILRGCRRLFQGATERRLSVAAFYWGVEVKPFGHAIQAVAPLAGPVLLSEVDLVAAS